MFISSLKKTANRFRKSVRASLQGRATDKGIERSPEGLAAPQMRCRFAILFLGAGLRAPGVGLTFRLNVIICTRVNVGIEVAVVVFNQSCLLRLIAASLPLPLN